MWEALRPTKVDKIFANIGPQLSNLFIMQHRLSNAVLLDEVDPKYLVKYNLQLTPETILIGRNGRIERMWVGLLSSQDLRQIESSLGQANK